MLQRSFKSISTQSRFLARNISISRLLQEGEKGSHGEKVENITQEILREPKVISDVLKSLRDVPEGNQTISIVRSFAKEVEKMDKNKDGIITFEEYKDWLNHRSNRLSGIGGAEIETELNSAGASRPTNEQLFLVALNAGAPFIGFGFLDNAIMILAGNEIEVYFGASLGISAMAAAALGNTISDMAGIQAGGIIESASTKLGIKDPKLTLDQMKMNICRYVTILAQLLGIMIGCVLGMFPLLFIEEDDNQQAAAVMSKQQFDENGMMEVRCMKLLLNELLKGDENINVDAFFSSLNLSDSDKIDSKECQQLYKSFLSLKSFETARTAGSLIKCAIDSGKT